MSQNYKFSQSFQLTQTVQTPQSAQNVQELFTPYKSLQQKGVTLQAASFSYAHSPASSSQKPSSVSTSTKARATISPEFHNEVHKENQFLREENKALKNELLLIKNKNIYVHSLGNINFPTEKNINLNYTNNVELPFSSQNYFNSEQKGQRNCQNYVNSTLNNSKNEKNERIPNNSNNFKKNDKNLTISDFKDYRDLRDTIKKYSGYSAYVKYLKNIAANLKYKCKVYYNVIEKMEKKIEQLTYRNTFLEKNNSNVKYNGTGINLSLNSSTAESPSKNSKQKRFSHNYADIVNKLSSRLSEILEMYMELEEYVSQQDKYWDMWKYKWNYYRSLYIYRINYLELALQSQSSSPNSKNNYSKSDQRHFFSKANEDKFKTAYQPRPLKNDLYYKYEDKDKSFKEYKQRFHEDQSNNFKEYRQKFYEDKSKSFKEYKYKFHEDKNKSFKEYIQKYKKNNKSQYKYNFFKKRNYIDKKDFY